MKQTINLGGPGYYYLATVYSKHKLGIEAAFQEACNIAGRLLLCGVNVYSPIAHTHPIAIHANIDPLDHGIWIPADQPLMDAAKGLLVATMDGWESSYGIGCEIKSFKSQKKPIFYLDPATLEVTSKFVG